MLWPKEDQSGHSNASGETKLLQAELLQVSYLFPVGFGATKKAKEKAQEEVEEEEDGKNNVEQKQET